MEIIADSLYKEFDDFPVVNHVSFRAVEGKVLGILGPNGAGKTTTLRMILDIIKPDSGKVLINDQPLNSQLRNEIGYLPEERGIYQKYPVIDTLVYFARLKNLSEKKAQVEAVRWLDRFEMVDYIDRPVKQLSKGMQQQLQLIIALIHNPKILIFDEPFAGLDPINQDLVRQIINKEKQSGKTILLSTHQMAEAEQLCDEILLIHEGEIVLEGTLERIRDKFKENIIIVEARDDIEKLKKLSEIRDMEISNNLAKISIHENVPLAQFIEKVIRLLEVSKLEINRPSLNDIFLEVVKRSRKNRL